MTTAGWVFAALITAGLAACDGGLEPEPHGPSRVELQYAGPLTGSFTVEGEIRAGEADMLGNTYAYGLRYDTSPPVEVRANRYDEATNMADWVQILIPGSTTGTSPIDWNQCQSSEPECASVSLVLQLLHEHGEQARYSCSLMTGTISVTSISSTRAKGTFSGIGGCIDRDAAGGEMPSVQITGGQFDVNLVGGRRE